MTHVFDAIADIYDQWYDTPEGQAIFEAEVACLRLLCGESRGRWLEVGVGTGRFAVALGVAEGIDASPRMLRTAARRGIRTCAAAAERLPFPDDAFQGVLIAMSLCFFSDAKQAMRESARVVAETGRLVIGLIPGDGPWGRHYARKAAEGHPVYSSATFYTTDEVIALATRAGFEFLGGFSGLFTPPGSPVVEGLPREGILERAGFTAMAFLRQGTRVLPNDQSRAARASPVHHQSRLDWP